MSIKLYMDVQGRRGETQGLRRRGVDVVTAQEDGSARLSDRLLLERARSVGRVIFSQDDDLLREARRCQRDSDPFAGVVYAHQLRITTGQAVRDLELLAKVYEPEDLENRVEYLPL